ncbi:hypothetical protein phytr_3680 [Candidatus Phycorickettsia trachydisci]|uniref:Uncharacterized protein n=1 Tax=Candidatus Phycorickettsia trachydisci TaxID=2115978 RepID=A0A2P1P7S4_9RICK|nr:hypothetical protein [Candidatus Phycorickettsia trachydisci]AVP87319.1 hypothetical protein phytr_3680 [Candidatus Phycorickettsia trachydisci]
MYKGLISELQKPHPNVQEIIHLLTTGRPQTFFDKLFRTLSEPQALGIFYYSTSKGNNFFHSSAEKGILSDVLSVINHYKDAILERERVSSDNLHDNLNAVNNAGLTPAHIAIKTDPVALWWLMELKAVLTSNDYSKVLTDGSISKSPLEFIFENEEIAHNVLKNIFWQVIQSGSWKFFDLFKTESPEVQEKFNKYLKNIPQEVGKFRGPTTDSFSKLFQNHWEDILDEPEHGKVTRLIEKIGEINWSELLGKEDWDNNLDKVKEHILTNCSLLYLNKFNPIKHITGKNPTLEHATLEQILLLLQSESPDNEEFRKIKRYVENSQNDTGADLETIELTAPDQSEEQKTSTSNSNHNHKKLGKRSQKENFIDNKENSSVVLNQNQDVKNDKLPFSIESFTSILEEELSKEQHAGIFNAQLEKIKKTATDLDRNFKIDLQLCSLISAASKKEFRKIFKHVIDKFEEAPFANKNDFLKEYIGNLCNTNKAHPNHTTHQILNYAYAITCITQNDDVMKFLVQKIKLGTYPRGTDHLFHISFNLKAQNVMKYLLSEEADLKIDLTYLLSQVQKYPSLESIEIIGHYIQYQKFIKNSADNEDELKKCNEDIFKTILHIAKASIKSLTRLNQEKRLDDTIEKTTKIYQAMERLIDEYDLKTPKIVEIQRLLNSLNKYSAKTLKLLPSEESKKNLESLVQDFREFIFNKYPKDDSYDEQVKNIIDFFMSGNYEELGSSYSSAPSVFPCYPSQKSEYSSSLIGTDSVDTDVIIN